MPRMSASDKQKSHQRILEAASRLFRERGIEATSVGDVMKAAGLTHGGFYRHFASKEALVAAAFRQAVDEVVAEVESTSPGRERMAARNSYIARYLSLKHIQDRSHGCPIAAMGGEIIQINGGSQAEASDAVERIARLLSAVDDRVTGQGLAIMALLLGSITLARLAETQELAEAVLDAGKRGTDLLVEQSGVFHEHPATPDSPCA